MQKLEQLELNARKNMLKINGCEYWNSNTADKKTMAFSIKIEIDTNGIWVMVHRNDEFAGGNYFDTYYLSTKEIRKEIDHETINLSDLWHATRRKWKKSRLREKLLNRIERYRES